MKRLPLDRYIIKVVLGFILITIGVILIISYIPFWVWLCIIGFLLIVSGCCILKRWR